MEKESLFDQLWNWIKSKNIIIKILLTILFFVPLAILIFGVIIGKGDFKLPTFTGNKPDVSADKNDAGTQKINISTDTQNKLNEIEKELTTEKGE